MEMLMMEQEQNISRIERAGLATAVYFSGHGA